MIEIKFLVNLYIFASFYFIIGAILARVAMRVLRQETELEVPEWFRFPIFFSFLLIWPLNIVLFILVILYYYGGKDK